MSCMEDKLEYLKETKRLIKEKLIEHGADISDETSFRNYPAAIESLMAPGTSGPLKTLFDATGKTEYFMYNTTVDVDLSEVLFYDDTANVTSMKNMFYKTAQTSIPDMNTSKVTDMSYMFNGCGNLTNIPSLNTSQVTNFSNMFSSCKSLTSIPQLDTSKATNVGSMFSYTTALTSIPELDLPAVSSLSYMFRDSGIKNVSLLNTSNVTNTSYMFTYSAVEGITSLDTSKVTNMESMFAYCDSLSTFPTVLDFSSATTTTYMCRNCTSLTSVPDLVMPKVTNVGMMFAGCSNLTNVGKITANSLSNYNSMFQDCTSLVSAPEMSFPDGKSVLLESLFWGCTSLTDASAIDITNVVSLYGTFGCCTALETTPSWDVRNVTYYDNIFTRCSNLKRCNFRNIRKSISFGDCTNLTIGSIINIIGELVKSNGTYQTLTLPSKFQDTLSNVMLVVVLEDGITDEMLAEDDLAMSKYPITDWGYGEEFMYEHFDAWYLNSYMSTKGWEIRYY